MFCFDNKIKFNKPVYVKKFFQKISRFSGDGIYTKKVEEYISNKYKTDALLTNSCTSALEMAALLCNITIGDEVIMPSYTFTSTANAFAIRGATCVFVDVDSNFNIDSDLVEKAITNRTKTICCVHYAGNNCNIENLQKIAKKYNLFLIEDAAHIHLGKSVYKDKMLGTFGDFGCFSFHETKNLNMGEGGALLINNKKFLDRARIIREKGTNRFDFINKKINKYSWVDIGSSYIPSELNSLMLFNELKYIDKIFLKRKKIWNMYYNNLKDICKTQIESGSYHMFYLLTDNRDKFCKYMLKNGIEVCSHYEPLHLSEYGSKNCLYTKLYNTENLSKKIVRLPLYYDLSIRNVKKIIKVIKEYYERDNNL